MIKAISRLTLFTLSGVCLVACNEQDSSQDSQVQDSVSEIEEQQLQTLDQRFSYAYGAELAERFKNEGINLDVALMAAGMNDLLNGELKMTIDEVVATTREFEQLHYEKKEAEKAVVAEKNKTEGEAFLAANAKKEGVVVTDSGLQYKIIIEGQGDYSPKEFDEVTVHYVGTTVDGAEFDSSYKRGKPHVSIVKSLIDGWVEALPMMSVGAKWELVVPANLAYGEHGSGNWIGPNAVLVFEVELLDIKKEEDQV